MSKVLITGGSGFLGTNLVEHHLAKGDSVLNVDILPPRCASHAAQWARVDITDRESLTRAILDFDPEYIYHMAARTDLDGTSLEAYASNTTGVSNVVSAAKELGHLRRASFASSLLVCKLGYRPTDEHDYCADTLYGESKILGEKIVRREGADIFEWTLVRPTSIWGPWFDVPYKNFFDAVRGGLYMHPRGRTVRRSYGFVLNAVFEFEKLMVAPVELVRGKTFYVADYDPTDVRRWANLIRAAFGRKGRVREVPFSLMKVASRAGDVLKRCGVRYPPLTSRRLANLLTEAIYDLDPVKEICGPLPYSLEESVAMTVEWMRSQQ